MEEMRTNKRSRKQIEKLIAKKQRDIGLLEEGILSLQKEALLLTDKWQRFEEKEEEVVISRRPKKIEKRLIGRVFWKEDFVDEDTDEVITVERQRIVRENGIWVSL